MNLTIEILNSRGVSGARFSFSNPRNFRLTGYDDVLAFEHDGGRRTWVRGGGPAHVIQSGRTEMFGVDHRFYLDGVECSPRLLPKGR